MEKNFRNGKHIDAVIANHNRYVDECSPMNDDTYEEMLESAIDMCCHVNECYRTEGYRPMCKVDTITCELVDDFCGMADIDADERREDGKLRYCTFTSPYYCVDTIMDYIKNQAHLGGMEECNGSPFWWDECEPMSEEWLDRVKGFIEIVVSDVINNTMESAGM
jgi:hypothetical protein